MKEYVIFKLNNENYGLDINNVENIEKVLPITRVPYTADYVAGVINLRGNIAPVVDMRKRFELEEKAVDSDSRIIIINLEGNRIGMIVDASSEVIQLEDKDIDTAPKIKKDNHIDFVQYIGKKEGRIIMLVDLYKILDIENED